MAPPSHSAATEVQKQILLENFIAVGELSVTGAMRPCKGVLPIALCARSEGKIGVLVPAENAGVCGLTVIPIQNLREAAEFLEGEIKVPPTKVDFRGIFDPPELDDLDFADVKGQEFVKRALGIAAAGGHCVLLAF